MTRARRLGLGEFAKYEALGNDYLVVDGERFGARLHRSRIQQLCDRHRGVGSDGVLVVGPSQRADFRLRVWNPDGSEAEKSGNGLRICARFLCDAGYTRRSSFSIETRGGVCAARVAPGGRAIRIEMGPPSFRSTDLGMRGRPRDVVAERLRVDGRDLRVTCVSLGNPHCVIFVPRLRPAALRLLGPKVERHRRFPKRINVQLAHVRSRSSVDVLIWERGAGDTLASGSSATAVVAAAHRLGSVDSRVVVRMPGGQLWIEVAESGDLAMTGPASPVFRGTLASDRLRRA